jgi:plastocyanin domain-containing protein
MSIKRKVLPGILSLGIILSIIGNLAIANSQEATMNKRNKFAKIEQPLVLKVAVTLGGLGLIGAEVWWFVLSKPKAQRQK